MTVITEPIYEQIYKMIQRHDTKSYDQKEMIIMRHLETGDYQLRLSHKDNHVIIDFSNNDFKSLLSYLTHYEVSEKQE